MNTAVINIKTDSKVKKQAQRVAAELGFSLSALVNGYLRELVRTQRVSFSIKEEELSPLAVEGLKKSEKDRRANRVSPTFDNAKDLTAWLNDKNRKYQNQVK